MRRPLSPHLQIYKVQITSGLSALHRITNILLIFFIWGALFYIALAYLNSLLFIKVQSFLNSRLYQLYWWGFSTLFAYHGWNELRHVYWDFGKGYSVASIEKSGKIVLILTFMSTVLLGIYLWGGA